MLKKLSVRAGNREQGTGNRKRVLSDFTFLYTVWFYCVHLLRDFQLKKYPKMSCGAGRKAC
ncbi:MAG: hypothetical protein HEQ13_02080 [Dolichospermum sp. DEX189]|nr:hypothetical protein [Dolichospermum sp. DEX189]